MVVGFRWEHWSWGIMLEPDIPRLPVLSDTVASSMHVARAVSGWSLPLTLLFTPPRVSRYLVALPGRLACFIDESQCVPPRKCFDSWEPLWDQAATLCASRCFRNHQPAAVLSFLLPEAPSVLPFPPGYARCELSSPPKFSISTLSHL